MTQLTLAQAQADMRRGYYGGAPGILASGSVWLTAGLASILASDMVAILSLLIGGALIHPLAMLGSRLLGRSGAHSKGNPLALLAIESTLWMFAGIAIAFAMHILRLEWFFPAMLLVIGGRYLTFQTLYGLRIYWLFGATLCAAGLALALNRSPVALSALTGAGIELIFAVATFVRMRNEENRTTRSDEIGGSAQ
jgi:hypothetical protein